MFRKNLKYELMASSRVLIPLFISVLVISILIACSFAGLGAFGNISGDSISTEEPVELGKADQVITTILSGMLTLLMVAFFIVICAALIAVFVLMVRRFYTSFFTDEGYLTFTLPVTVDCHLATKTVAMIIWSVACDVVILISLGIFMLGVYALVPEAFQIDDVALQELKMAFGQIFETLKGSAVFSVINVIVSSIASYFLLFFSISVGCMLTKKHRFIVCAACVLVISGAVTQIINIGTSLVTLPFSDMGVNESSLDLLGMATLLVSTVMYIAQGVGCYLGTRWILKNRVNLD